MPKILLLLPDSSERLVELTKEETTLGRVPGNDIVVQYDSLSGKHARFLLKGDACVLEDLNSTNGTFVNGVPTQRAELAHGDQMQFGELVVEFQSDSILPESDEEPPAETVEMEEPEEAILDPEPDLAHGHGQSRRPASFTSISPLKRVPSNNHSKMPLVAAAVVGFAAVGAALYSILTT